MRASWCCAGPICASPGRRNPGMLLPRPPAWLAAFAARIENGRLTDRTTGFHRHRCDAGDAGHRRAVGIRNGAVHRPGLAFHCAAHRGGPRWRCRAERDAGRAGQGQRPRRKLHRPVGARRNARRHDRQPRAESGGTAAGTAGAVPRGRTADGRQRPGGGRRCWHWRSAARRPTGAVALRVAPDAAARHRAGGKPARPGCLAARAAARRHHHRRDRPADRDRLLC